MSWKGVTDCNILAPTSYRSPGFGLMSSHFICCEQKLRFGFVITLWHLCVYGLIHPFSKYLVSSEGNGTPLQYWCLENPTDGGAWWAAVQGVAKSRTRLSNFTFTFMHRRRKWQPTPVFLPGESQGQEPGGLPSMGSHRVRHD